MTLKTASLLVLLAAAHIAQSGGLLGTGVASAQGVTSSSVSFWTASDAFARGPLLLDRMDASKYNVYAVRRDQPGAVELHTLDTDIVFILEGAATFVTGGSVTDSRARGDEITGTGIQNGEAHQLGRGDVVIVPNGTPHWFRNVSPTVSYFAVKLRQAGSGTPVPASVRVWKGSEVFAKGGVLYEGKEGPYVRVYAIRRDKPLAVELHALDTDVVFMMDGAGTFVTGGTIADPRVLGPTESSGSGIADGQARQIRRGDVLVVPKATPHWLRDVGGGIEFFAVKVR